MFKTLIFFILLLPFSDIKSQESEIGNWSDRSSYFNANSVTVAGTKVFCATKSFAYSYDLSDFTIEKLNKINGFSDIGSKLVVFSKHTNTTIIVYENANIDLVKQNTIINISDIKRAVIPGLKGINEIFLDKQFAYLACDFGIVVLDLIKSEIKDTYYIGNNGTAIVVNDVTILNDTIYAATNNGILQSSTQNNLTNYAHWSLTPTPITTGKFSLLESFNGSLFISEERTISGNITNYNYQRINDNWSLIDSARVYNFNSSVEYLTICYENSFDKYDQLFNRISIQNKYEGWETPHPREVAIDSKGNYWISDKNSGLIKMTKDLSIERITATGPKYNDISHFSIFKGDLWVATGGYSVLWHNMWLKNGLMSLQNNNWSFINGLNTEALDTIWDVIHVNINPNNKDHIFVSSFGWGLIEILNNKVITAYTSSNSSLKPNSDGYTKITSSVFDTQGNLWVANAQSSSSLSVKKTDGVWRSFYFDETRDLLTNKIIVDKNNYKWILLPKSEGILVFDDAGTIEDTIDDRHIKLGFTEGSGNIQGGEVSSIAVDNDGYVWIGSDQGISVVYNPSEIFDGAEAKPIKIVQDGNVQLLLETETVTTIAVDGANRKWIGTSRGGAFLVSEDGTTQIHAFNIDNSPILSNSITHIDINQENGEVFFGTDKGIISYKSTATEPKVNYSNVYVYPNPVKPDFTGLIAIKGLIANTEIKITDIGGKLIYETFSLGGQAIWDGSDFSGNKAKSGVYLIFASDSNGEKALVTKLLLLD